MNYKKFIQNINFGGLSPMDEGIILLCGQAENPITTLADFKITTLPENNSEMKEKLKELCKIPRMSTFAVGSLINMLVSDLPEKLLFVNVGVWQGFSFLSGIISNPEKNCIGVDNFSEFGGPKDKFLERFEMYKSDNHLFYDMDYQEYFKSQHSGEIGFYIYDGNHEKEHQREGLKYAEPFLAKDSYILVDDINLDDPINGTIEFVQQSSHEYEIIFEQNTAHNSHPTFWNGIALLRKLT